jgi:hypothetical protein
MVLCGAALAAALIGLSGSALAQSDQTLPIPGGEVAKDLPGAKELPDPNMIYKVVFDIASAAPKVDDVNPGLSGVVRYVNTLAKCGLTADHRKIALVFHRSGTEVVLNNETFKARKQGHENPNVALIQSVLLSFERSSRSGRTPPRS